LASNFSGVSIDPVSLPQISKLALDFRIPADESDRQERDH
jgi:hypothetical protein